MAVTPRRRLAGLWFPGSLLLLLLLFLPGVVLLVLHLFGKESTVNGWLQEHLNLSYHLAPPWWASLALFLMPFCILLLYFLKMKRQAQRSPSTFLWKKTIEDLHVNSLFQWLRDNVLLLLQLLTVIVLIASLLAFQFHGKGGQSRYILIIDSSASMAATDVTPSRLEVAKAEALAEIDRHADGDTGMVLEFNARAVPRQDYTSDKALLRRAVRDIEQTQRVTRIEEALALADGLANPQKSTEDMSVRPANEDPAQARQYLNPEGLEADVHLYSDGCFSDAANFAAGNLRLRYHRIGQPGADVVDNVGIVAFNALRERKEIISKDKEPKKDREPKTEEAVLVFVRVQNFRKRESEVKVRLQCKVVGDTEGRKTHLDFQTKVIAGRTVTPPDPDKNDAGGDRPGEEGFAFELPDRIRSSDTVLLEASLEGNQDHFPLDDRAWLVLGVGRKARVLVVTDDASGLHKLFRTEKEPKKDDNDEEDRLTPVGKIARVEFLKPEELQDEAKYVRRAREGAFDLVVFDRCAPAADALPLANTFFLDAMPPPWKKPTETLRNVRILNPSSGHPLMQYLSGLDNIYFKEAFRFDLNRRKDDPDLGPPPPDKVPRLLETEGDVAVLFTLPHGAYTHVVLASPLQFDPRKEWPSNWPGMLSFPIFLDNLLHVYGYARDGVTEEPLRPGEVLTVRPEVGTDTVEVSGPLTLDNLRPPERDARKARQGSGGEFLFDRLNQCGLYRARWQDGERWVAVNLLDAEESNLEPRDAVQIGAQRVEAAPMQGRPWETWRWIALVAIGLLLLEWLFYNKRYFTF